MRTAWERGQDHDQLLADDQIEEGRASLDAYEASILPQEGEESPREIALDAAQMGLRLLNFFIAETLVGVKPTVTLQEIGAGLMGKRLV